MICCSDWLCKVGTASQERVVLLVGLVYLV